MFRVGTLYPGSKSLRSFTKPESPTIDKGRRLPVHQQAMRAVISFLRLSVMVCLPRKRCMLRACRLTAAFDSWVTTAVVVEICIRFRCSRMDDVVEPFNFGPLFTESTFHKWPISYLVKTVPHGRSSAWHFSKANKTTATTTKKIQKTKLKVLEASVCPSRLRNAKGVDLRACVLQLAMYSAGQLGAQAREFQALYCSKLSYLRNMLTV